MVLDTGNRRYYGCNDDGSIWINHNWAFRQLEEKYRMKLMDMDEDQLVEEYLNKFGDPNRP